MAEINDIIDRVHRVKYGGESFREEISQQVNQSGERAHFK